MDMSVGRDEAIRSAFMPLEEWMSVADTKNWKPETIALHGVRPEPTSKAGRCRSTRRAYVFDSAQHAADLFALKVRGNIYTRIMNPTTDVLEKRLAALEGGIGALGGGIRSGGGDLLDSQRSPRAGDNIVARAPLYGGTYNLFAHTLPQYGMEMRFADYRRTRELRAADR